MRSVLQQLADRQEIADVLARFCERIDEYDIDAIAELFAEDCVVDTARAAVASREGGRRCAHACARARASSGARTTSSGRSASSWPARRRRW